MGAAIVVLLLAFAFRVRNLGAESAWMDEAYSIALAGFPLDKIIQGTAADQHPPLYYLLLHLWMLPGSGVFFARFLSLLIGIINIAQVMALGRRLGGSAIGGGVGLLLAISPFHVWYSQEARMYILLATFTTAATTELWLCLQGRKRWLLYTLFCLFSLYTQYFALFIFIAHGLLVVLQAARSRRLMFLGQWTKAMLAVALGFGVWFPVALNQMRFHMMPWIGRPDIGSIRDALLALFWGNEAMGVPTGIRWLAFAGLGIMVLWGVFKLYLRRPANWSGFELVAFWALIPFFLIVLTSLYYPIFQTKQFLLLVGAFVLLFTFIVQLLPRPAGVLLLFVSLLFAGVSVLLQQSILHKDDWRGAAQYIQQGYGPGDVVYSNPAASALALSLYAPSQFVYDGYPPDYSILSGGWKNGQTITPQIADTAMRLQVRQHMRIWLVESYPQLWDPSGALESWLSVHAFLAADKQFTNVRVRLYQLRPESPQP